MIDRAIISAVQSLCRIDDKYGMTLVHTPLLYVGGSQVSVRVTPIDTGGYEVDDLGSAMREASLVNLAGLCDDCAKDVAKKTGMLYSDGKMSTRVPKDRLPGAIATVANASQEVLYVTLRVAPQPCQHGRADWRWCPHCAGVPMP